MCHRNELSRIGNEAPITKPTHGVISRRWRTVNRRQTGGSDSPRAAVTTRTCYNSENVLKIWMAAGPNSTMKSAGKMQNTSGNTIFTGAANAFSWAR